MNAEVELTVDERIALAGWRWDSWSNAGYRRTVLSTATGAVTASGGPTSWGYHTPQGKWTGWLSQDDAVTRALDAWGIPRTRPAPVVAPAPKSFRPFKMDSNEWVNDGLAPIRLTPERYKNVDGWRARVTMRCPGGHRFSVWAPTPAEAVASAVARLRKYAFFANAAANHLEDLAATGCPEVTQ